MRCHWSLPDRDEAGRFVRTSSRDRVWIPGCHGGIHGPDRCACPRSGKHPQAELLRLVDHMTEWWGDGRAHRIEALVFDLVERLAHLEEQRVPHMRQLIHMREAERRTARQVMRRWAGDAILADYRRVLGEVPK